MKNAATTSLRALQSVRSRTGEWTCFGRIEKETLTVGTSCFGYPRAFDLDLLPRCLGRGRELVVVLLG